MINELQRTIKTGQDGSMCMRGSNPAFLHAEKKKKRKNGTRAYSSTYCVNDASAKGLFENVT
jgi:hypothetical protein